MRQVLSAQSIANTVRFSRSGKPLSTALILEGSTDVKLYRNLIDDAHCEMYFAAGKERVFEVLANLTRDRTAGVIAIVDADCDHLANTVSTNPNVITTETRDIEGLLLKLPSLEKVLNEYDHPLQVSGTSTRDLIQRAARTLGYVRWLALRRNWSLDFKLLSFVAFIDGYKIECDDKRLGAELIAKNEGFGVPGPEIVNASLQLADPSHDLWSVTNGHDMTKILSVAICARGKTVYSTAVESALRLALEVAHFKTTLLFAAICTWQRNNRPFVILKLGFS